MCAKICQSRACQNAEAEGPKRSGDSEAGITERFQDAEFFLVDVDIVADIEA